MTARVVRGARYTLDNAPAHLNQIQAAEALGISVHQLSRMEKELPNFPKRQTLEFSRQGKFRLDDLRDWYQANRSNGDAELGAA